MDEWDMMTMLMLLQYIARELEELIDSLESILSSHIREQRRLNRSLPVSKRRITWTAFKDKVSDDHFRRMFRMKLPSFEKLCTKIIDHAGEDVFYSEEYLMRKHPNNWQLIAGEVKVAVCIRLLAGGSYLDLVPLFDVSKSHIYNLIRQFIDWILAIFEFPLVGWIRGGHWDVLEFLANQFAEKSDGIFYGPFGSLDGLAIRIASPKKKEVSDPGNYYCRKGFYAFNVQAICDKKKRFLWAYPSNKGSTHDSSAFNASRLYDLLCEEVVWRALYERGLFLAGDSAYSLSPFLVVPYSVDEMRNDVNGGQDSFNFHLSSCRICIECAFGELVMRWGIFWRTLLFDLKLNGKIAHACMLLHNFIVDEREDDDEDKRFFSDFNSVPYGPLLSFFCGCMSRWKSWLALCNNNSDTTRRLPPLRKSPGQLGQFYMCLSVRFASSTCLSKRNQPNTTVLVSNFCGLTSRRRILDLSPERKVSSHSNGDRPACGRKH